MISGAHFLLYSKQPDADRAFLHDVLGLRAVDANGGWLIFALPPAELAVHPSEETFVQRHAEHELLGAVLYFMCHDLTTMIHDLNRKHVECSEIQQAEWGRSTTVKLPSGGRLGLYEPAHLTAIEWKAARAPSISKGRNPRTAKRQSR